MSKIEELINQLCPDGVRGVPLGSLMFRIRERGKYAPSVSRVYAVSNTLGIVDADEFRENAIHSEDTSNYTVIREGMVAYNPSRLNIGSIAMLESPEPGLVSPMYVVFSIDENKICRKYFSYLIKSSYVLSKIDALKEEGARFRFDYSRWNWITVPLPPLNVQNEIVRILNSFTELTADLTAELALRKKQYEYYRDTLLSFDGRDDFEMSTIGSLSNYRRGSFPQPYGNREWYDGDGAMPFVQVADIGEDMLLVPDTKRKISKIAQPKSVFAPAGSIIISLQGSIGRIAITQYDAFIDRTVAIFQDIDKKILPKYFVYQLQRIFAIKEKTARGSTIKTITKEEFTSFPIPIPSIEEQKRVVSILDRFNKLCSDVAEGLPAEIIGRNRQYEYYRDKLLTFKELKAA